MGRFSNSNGPKSGKKWWVIALAIVFIFAIKFFDEVSVKILDAYFFLTKPAQIVSELSKNVNSTQDNLKIIEELRTKNITLLHEVNTLKFLEFENKKLLTLLGIKRVKGYEFIGAKVTVNIDYEKKDNFIFIDKGKESSIKEGSAVINADGLIGRITQVGNNWSRVMLVQNLKSRVPVLMIKSDVEALISGDSKDAVVEIVSENKKLLDGDKVITSGTGELFPKGIVVGTYKNNKVISSVNYDNLDYVLVVQENKDAEADDVFSRDSTLKKIAHKYLPSLFNEDGKVVNEEKKSDSSKVEISSQKNLTESASANQQNSNTQNVQNLNNVGKDSSEKSLPKTTATEKDGDKNVARPADSSTKKTSNQNQSTERKFYILEKNQIL